MSRAAGRVYIAEITTLEIVSAMARHVRGSRMSVGDFQRANLRFLRDIADRKLLVLRFGSADFIGCRNLISLVGVTERKNLRAQDAMVASTARRLAFEQGKKVKLLTSDWTLAAIIRDLPIFHGSVESEYLP